VQADELAFTPITRQAELVRNGEISPRELVEVYLERIGRIDPTINAFRVVMAERALVEARQAEARPNEGNARPPLGVPIAIKDASTWPARSPGWGSTSSTRPPSAMPRWYGGCEPRARS
jgi:amidase